MYLRVGGKLRPFNEATAAISYVPRYDLRRRIVQVEERWDIRGRIIQQTNATQTNMTHALRVLDADFSQHEPDLVFVEDDGVTESALQMRRGDCIMGPYIGATGLPSDGADIYATGVSYTVTMVGIKRVASPGANIIVEFSEELDNPEGGQVRGYVGGSINLPELQVFRQYAPYVYIQSGRAVGLYGPVSPPFPLWPSLLMREPQVTHVGPRVQGRVPQEFEVRWRMEFQSPFPLQGRPHILT